MRLERELMRWTDWILPDLPTVTKILLRHEMARPPSDKDEEGYVYLGPAKLR